MTSTTEPLRGIELFAGLGAQEYQQVIQVAGQRRLEAEQYLFFEGDPADHIYVLQEGRVKLVQTTPDGQQVTMHYIAPGEAFGVIAVLSNMPYPVTAQAVVESHVLYWDRKAMVHLMELCPRIAINAIQILAERIREFQDRIRELATERVERRIARALLRLARQSGKKVSEGVLIDLPLSRQDLAEMSGTTLYTVSRTLSQWESQGLVYASRETVIIRNPHGLVMIAEDLPS